MDVPWKYKWKTIGDSYIDSWEIMRKFLNGWPNISWCNCSAVWWYSESNILHHSDDTCQRLTKVSMLWIIIHNLWSKLNIKQSTVITRYTYQPVIKEIYSSPEICGNILNIFWGGIKTTKYIYRIHWETWIWIILLETVFYLHLCLVLGIYDIGFT